MSSWGTSERERKEMEAYRARRRQMRQERPVRLTERGFLSALCLATLPAYAAIAGHINGWW